MVTRILAPLASVDGLGPRRQTEAYLAKDHLKASRAVAGQSTVLLKKNAKALPLSAPAGRLVVIGSRCSDGVLSGGGSTSVTPPGSVRAEGLSLPQFDLPRIYHRPAPLAELRRRFSGIEVLTEEITPSGRLPVTFPRSQEQLPRPRHDRSEGDDLESGDGAHRPELQHRLRHRASRCR